VRAERGWKTLTQIVTYTYSPDGRRIDGGTPIEPAVPESKPSHAAAAPPTVSLVEPLPILAAFTYDSGRAGKPIIRVIP
jgi:hypothetical protein